jgi:cytochrome c oxidase cbb3-type subunit 3
MRRLQRNKLFTCGTLIVAVAASVLFVVASCKREDRGLRVDPPAASEAYLPTNTPFHVGPTSEPAHIANGYDENAYAIQQGQLLYNNFNCVGCHFHGGGGIGPALMDDKWIYGSQPDQIFATIIQGRPNGMPSFREKIPDYKVWQIVAYVRSLSGLASSQASSGRSDDMQMQPPPNSMSKPTPVQSGEPPSAKTRL